MVLSKLVSVISQKKIEKISKYLLISQMYNYFHNSQNNWDRFGKIFNDIFVMRTGLLNIV